MALGHPATGVAGVHWPDRCRELGRIDSHAGQIGLAVAPAGGAPRRCHGGDSAHWVAVGSHTLQRVGAARPSSTDHIRRVAGHGGRAVRALPETMTMAQTRRSNSIQYGVWLLGLVYTALGALGFL